MRNQIWENLHPISHLASEKWEVGPKREFSSLKVYPLALDAPLEVSMATAILSIEGTKGNVRVRNL